MNSHDPREVLRSILEIINYQDDNETFIDEFLDRCFHRAFVSLAATLPTTERKDLEQKLAKSQNDIKKTQEIIEPYISREDYSLYTQQATAEMLAEFLKSVMPKLNDNQKLALSKYIESFFPKNLHKP